MPVQRVTTEKSPPILIAKALTGAQKLEKAIMDINGRVKEMYENGIQVQVLSFTSPGCQACTSAAEGEALAREANK
jgi:2,3-dihydroxybenzoate decarboxylase